MGKGSKTKSTTYVSLGTVRATTRFDGIEPNGSVYFIPTPDYSVKHNGEQFAAFVSKDKKSRLVRLADGDNSVSLECAESLFSVVAIAAATHVQVEVEVKKPTKDCKVIAITIPAK